MKSASSTVVHYLDTSVVSKLFSKEDGAEEIREYITKNPSFRFGITEFVYYESLGVLKRKKDRGEISKEQYLSAPYVFNGWIAERLIEIDTSYDIRDVSRSVELREIADKYDLDYSDALQLLTALHGNLLGHTPSNPIVFVTADKELGKAAADCGLKVWNFGEAIPAN